MKKLLLILMVGTALLSCKKEDDYKGKYWDCFERPLGGDYAKVANRLTDDQVTQWTSDNSECIQFQRCYCDESQ